MNIRLENLGKSYDTPKGVVQVFANLTIELKLGTFASLIGASGVGKSTLLHLLGTLDFPTHGQLWLNGVNPHQLSAMEMARLRSINIGFVFQFHHLLPEFSALENIMMPMLVQRLPASHAEKKAGEWLERVGLSHRIHHKPGELSGGEQQRVALARAYINEPTLILADEPTGNLDEETGDAIMRVMEQVHQERKITTIIVTHNPKLAQRAPIRLHLKKEGLLVSTP